MKNRLTIVSVFAVLVCFVGASAVAQSPEDPEALRRELAAERARLEEQMKRLDELEARLDAALAEEEAAPDAAPTTEEEKAVDDRTTSWRNSSRRNRIRPRTRTRS